MLTRNALAALSDSLRERAVLSVYLDGRTTDPAARLAWRSILDGKLTALRQRTRERGRDGLAELDRCIALLEGQLASVQGSLSAPGFVAFVTTAGVALIEALPVPMPNIAMWENGPWISPYLRAQKELRPLVFALVDARSARTYRYALGSLSPLERFHAHAHVDQPRHMGGAPRPSFHTGTRGATTTDAVDRVRQHGTRRMLRQLIEHIMNVAPTDEWILIGGMPTRVRLVLTMLPAAARERALEAPGLNTATSVSTLRRVASENAREMRQRLDRELVESAIGHAAEGGRGSAGEQATRAALAINDVHLLLVSAKFMSDHPDVVEQISRLALDEGAAVEIVTGIAADRLDVAGGVAAILRYVPSAAAAAAGQARG